MDSWTSKNGIWTIKIVKDLGGGFTYLDVYEKLKHIDNEYVTMYKTKILPNGTVVFHEANPPRVKLPFYVREQAKRMVRGTIK